MTTDNTIWNDDALDASDIPGRAEFAAAVAQRIDQVRVGQNSTVFGLVGAWGTGKSTLLTEIRTHLTGNDWTAVDFSPWSAGDVSSITAEFIATLAGAFPGANGKSLRKSLLKYARFGVPALSAIPIAGNAAAKVAEKVLTEFTTQPAWHDTFRLLSEQIAQEEKRVLVVVDDVDRLDYDELRAVLRVVRLLGRFHNVHYLLAYDQVTIDQNLRAGTAEGSSSEFMEKIVQHPFEVPPAPLVTRRSWCRRIVEAHSGAVQDDGLGNSYVDQKEDLIRILADGIETPRSARRLREQLDGLAALAADAEIDALDFIALTWLRLTQHAVWDDIRTRSDRYLGWSDDVSDELPDPRLAHLPNLVARGQTVVVSRVLQFLFIRATSGVLAGRKWRLHTDRYFHRYFVVGLTDADVSERLVDSALDEVLLDAPTTAAMDELRAIMVGTDGERGALAIDLAAAARKNAVTTTRSFMTFLRELHAEVSAIGGDRYARASTLDRWVGTEAERAIISTALDAAEFVEDFGYWQLVRAGYAARRRHKENFDVVRAPFDEAIARWIAKVRADGLPPAGESNEVAVMTGFAEAFNDTLHRGFLADAIENVDDLFAVGERFVDYNRWVGSDVRYEVIFRKNEFRFAVCDALNRIDLELLSPPSELPEYELHERVAPDLTADERRDYAIRSVAVVRDDAS